jgi:hypothetical protein
MALTGDDLDCHLPVIDGDLWDLLGSEVPIPWLA